MKREIYKRTEHLRPNGAFLKKVINRNMPEKKEMQKLVSRWTDSIPAVGQYLKENWKSVAVAATSLLLAAGAYSLVKKGNEHTED